MKGFKFDKLEVKLTSHFADDVAFLIEDNCSLKRIPKLTPKDWGGGGGFPPPVRFFANNFGSNKATHSKRNDFS